MDGMRKMNPLEKCEQCKDFIFEDVQTYTRQLEAQNAELVRKTEQLQRERDAAVADLDAIHVCSTCKHVPDDSIDYIQAVCFECCTTKCNYEWRGVPEGD